MVKNDIWPILNEDYDLLMKIIKMEQSITFFKF